MSFKNNLVKLLQKQIPDFVINPVESSNKYFCFTKTDEKYFYDIIFQISNLVPQFTVELTITRKKQDLSRSIILHKNERLGKIIYQKDYWWDYFPDNQTETVTILSQAISLLDKVYMQYFDQEKKELDIEYQKIIDKYQKKFPQISNLEL